MGYLQQSKKPEDASHSSHKGYWYKFEDGEWKVHVEIKDKWMASLLCEADISALEPLPDFVPPKEHKPEDFITRQLHKSIEIEARVLAFAGDMAVCADSLEGPVLITKEQAMKFFNLKEK